MKKEDFISSGILERYVLGLCTAEESAEVLRMSSTYPEIADEISEIELALIHYASEENIVPNRVKEGVMSQVMKNPSASLNPPPMNKVVEMKPVHRSFNWLSAASVALLIGSLIFNFVQFSKNNVLNSEIAQLRNDNSTFAKDLNASKAKYEETKQVFALLSDTSTQIINMKGVESSPNSLATIYWKKSTREVFLIVNSLVQVDAQSDYQLWAIVDGTPVNAGIIHVSDSSSIPQKMESFSNAQAFAVTLEKKGGSATPTLEKMVVIGSAS